MTAPTNTAPGYAGHSGAHTDGEWSVDERPVPNYGGSDLYIRSDARHWAIGVAHDSYGCSDAARDISEAEARANARLIAAAPQMLEALKVVQTGLEERAEMYGMESDALRLVRAAIAAAIGEEG